jgi:hypothetical protein
VNSENVACSPFSKLMNGTARQPSREVVVGMDPQHEQVDVVHPHSLNQGNSDSPAAQDSFNVDVVLLGVSLPFPTTLRMMPVDHFP